MSEKFSMKILIVFYAAILISISSALAASLKDPIPSPDFSYKVQQYPDIERDVSAALSVIDLTFTQHALNPVLMPENFKSSNTSLSQVTRIYSGDLGNTVVFVKTGVVPDKTELIGSAVSLAGGFLYHHKDQSGLVSAIFIRSESWENARDLFSTLGFKIVTKNHTKKEKSIMLSLTNAFVSSAYAKDPVTCDPKIRAPQDSLDNLVKASESLNTSTTSPIQHITGCALGALKGVWDGSAGTVIGFSKEAIAFLKSPVESGKKYWESTTQLWDVTKKFFGDFENEARKLYSSFDTLEPLVKTKLACHVLGTVGGSFLLSYVTGGVMATAAVESMMLKLRTAIKAAFGSGKFESTKALLAARAIEIEKAETSLNKSLFAIPRGSAKEAVAKNEQVLEQLKNLPINVESKRKIGLSDSEVQQLFREVYDHPVASLTKVSQYEKYQTGIGYCFGRATAAHIKALKDGVDKSSIRKVWALGSLKTGSSNWRYHVTTIVRNSKGEWIAIDPIFGRTMPVEEWYKSMKKFDATGNMRLFETEPKRFGPDGGGKYSPSALQSPFYAGYFTDLMKSFREEGSELAKLKSVTP